MDLNEIAVFIQVVQSQSFSAAAKKLGMPNSTVSHKVSSLEQRLGVTLIQRTTRKLNITPAGQMYYKKCMEGMESIVAAEQELASIQDEPNGLLRITAPVELGKSVLPGIVSKYVSKYPKVRVELILGGRRMDLLSENVDLAIRVGALQDSTLIAKKIGSPHFAPYATAKYLKSRGTPQHPRDLRLHDSIIFTPAGMEEVKLVGPKGSFNAALTSKIIVNDLDAVKDLVLMNEGIGFMQSFFCGPEIKSGKLVRLLPEWRSEQTPVHFVYPAQRFVSPKLKAFMEMALEPLKSILDYH